MSDTPSEQEANTLASAARSVMEKDIAKELMDMSVRHRGGPYHAESLLLGPLSIVVEEATDAQLSELGLLIFAIAAKLVGA